VMLTGFGTEAAIIGAVLYLLAHALFKGALFMVVGILDHETGTRDTRDLSGLRTAMPVTFVAALGAGLSMAGIPLFVGFMAKEAIYEALGGAADPASRRRRQCGDGGRGADRCVEAIYRPAARDAETCT
jgi:multicomponent Na+:H+ antiporter subunit A